MKTNSDFDRGRKGEVAPPAGKKVRITIRLDRDIVEWFKSRVEHQGEGSYQAMLNQALREHMDRKDPHLEKLLRKVVREEIRKAL